MSRAKLYIIIICSVVFAPACYLIFYFSKIDGYYRIYNLEYSDATDPIVVLRSNCFIMLGFPFKDEDKGGNVRIQASGRMSKQRNGLYAVTFRYSGDTQELFLRRTIFGFDAVDAQGKPVAPSFLTKVLW